MADAQDKLPFEDFPRENLNRGITRRQLLSTLATELHLFSGKREGSVGIKLANLGILPDEMLKDFIPEMVPGTQILIKAGCVCAAAQGDRQLVSLFKIDPITTYTFNLINGQNTLEEIAGQLSQQHALPYERAFSIARGMFLTFVKLGVCMPANNPSAG